MGINLGNTTIGSLYLGSAKIGAAYLGSTKVYSSVDPYNPLGLPPFTIRCKFKSGYTPTMGDSQTLVDATDNVWDITKNSTSWRTLFISKNDLLEVLGANASSVTDMSYMLSACESLTSVSLFDTSSVTNMDGMFGFSSSLPTVPLFDTSSVTEMYSMFERCTSLTSVPLFDTGLVTSMSGMFSLCSSLTTVPLFDTSSVTEMDYMFEGCIALTAIPLFDTSSVMNMNEAFSGCVHVEHGALALYQQASTQANPPEAHDMTFYDCGAYTTTGAAELAQIPSDWK